MSVAVAVCQAHLCRGKLVARQPWIVNGPGFSSDPSYSNVTKPCSRSTFCTAVIDP
ncbi:hypothetical protein K523DRAFT_322543 [Schizophyllum commune Tattone D]|nr:hypothetical protein K523DRAFT_322543 [Schizophyllum commune Tattone D]